MGSRASWRCFAEERRQLRRALGSCCVRCRRSVVAFVVRPFDSHNLGGISQQSPHWRPRKAHYIAVAKHGVGVGGEPCNGFGVRRVAAAPGGALVALAGLSKRPPTLFDALVAQHLQARVRTCMCERAIDEKDVLFRCFRPIHLLQQIWRD